MLYKRNPIDQLAEEVKRSFPDFKTKREGSGFMWWLDILVPGKTIVAQFQPPDRLGFSITCDDDQEALSCFTHQPDHACATYEEWRDQVFEAIRS